MKKLTLLLLIFITGCVPVGKAQTHLDTLKIQTLTTSSWNGLPDSIKKKLSNTFTGNNNFGIGTIKPIGWVTMGEANHTIFSIDNPKEHKGNYIFHLKRYKFHWLNDSTAIYITNQKRKKK